MNDFSVNIYGLLLFLGKKTTIHGGRTNINLS